MPKQPVLVPNLLLLNLTPGAYLLKARAPTLRTARARTRARGHALLQAAAHVCAQPSTRVRDHALSYACIRSCTHARSVCTSGRAIRARPYVHAIACARED
eukprot:6191365-Pleurochrysis_carterae.AAC.2